MRVSGLLALCLGAHALHAQVCTPAAVGAKALDRGDIAEAERVLAPFATAAPPCNEVLLNLARLRAAQKQAKAAEAYYLRYLEVAPRDAGGHLRFAQFLFAVGDYPRADTVSQKALALNPSNASALTLQGRLLVMKGESAKGQALLEKACKIDPSNADAHFQLGSFMDRAKHHAEAVREFEKVIVLDPRNPRAYDYLALNLEPLGQVERAGQVYQKGLQLNQGELFDSFLDYNYGRFLVKRNRLTDAKQHLDKAAELAPRVRAVRYERGKLHLRLGNYSDARNDAERALSLPDPGKVILDLQIYNLLQQIYARLGESELARQYAELSRKTPVPLKPGTVR